MRVIRQPTAVQNRSSLPNSMSTAVLPSYAVASLRSLFALFLKRQLTVNVADTRAREEIRAARNVCQVTPVTNSERRSALERAVTKRIGHEFFCATTGETNGHQLNV